MSDELRMLQQRIDRLESSVGEIRERLANCVQVANHPQDSIALARGVAESLTKRILEDMGIKPLALFDACLRELEKPEVMSRGLVPSEIISILHTVRVMGNKATHDLKRIPLKSSDVQWVLSSILRVVEWYFSEFERGPRIALLFRAADVDHMKSEPSRESPTESVVQRDTATPESDTAAYPAPTIEVNPIDGAEMIWIPPGEFLMGDDDLDGSPRRTVSLSGYWMYKNVVTVGMFKRFCTVTGYAMPEGPRFDPMWSKDDHPMVYVTWYDARAYCQWAHVVLPTEAQWEKAARGTDGRKFPWGDEFNSQFLWCSTDYKRTGTTAVGRRAVSPYGCTDMAGNVWQWCADWDSEADLRNAQQGDPGGSEHGKFRVFRGGSWRNGSDGAYGFRASYRQAAIPEGGSDNCGFRCASGELADQAQVKSGGLRSTSRSSLVDNKQLSTVSQSDPVAFQEAGNATETQRARVAGQISVFRVTTLDKWPYEGVESGGKPEIDAPINLETNLKWGTKYRYVPPDTNGSIDWGLLSHNINGGVNEDALGNDLVSSAVSLPQNLWIQVEYRLYSSTRRADDSHITEFRRRLMASGACSVPLWGAMQPAQVAVGSFNDPYFEWYEMGNTPEGEATYAFASSVSNLDYINAHTIPKGSDYQVVLASVIDFRSYTHVPSYDDLLRNFDGLIDWFISSGGKLGA